MRSSSGPPIGIWLPMQILLVWSGLYAISVAGAWLAALLFATVVVLLLPMAAITFLITGQRRAATVVLAVLPSVAFAYIVGPHVSGPAYLAAFAYVGLAARAIMGVLALWATFYLARQLPAGWRTPVWGDFPAVGSKPHPSTVPAVASSCWHD